MKINQKSKAEWTHQSTIKNTHNRNKNGQKNENKI